MSRLPTPERRYPLPVLRRPCNRFGNSQDSLCHGFFKRCCRPSCPCSPPLPFGKAETRMTLKRCAFCNVEYAVWPLISYLLRSCASKTAEVPEAEPAVKGVVTITVFTTGKENHHPAILEGLATILHGFVRLDEVYILRKPATGNNHQICLFINTAREMLCVKTATFQVFLPPVTSKCSNDAFIWRKNRVKHEGWIDHRTCLNHCLMHRIAVQNAGGGSAVFTAARLRVKNCKMTGHAGLTAGNTRQDRFSSSAETGKIMKADCAGQDHPVRLEQLTC